MTTFQILLSIAIAMFGMWMFFRLPVSASPLSLLINGFSGFFLTNEHGGRPTPQRELTDDMRYKGATPPANTSNVHGEIEYLHGNIPVIHWYEQANETTYHFVTAGDPAKEAVVILPGLPETWWAFHNQIAELSTDHYVIAIDPQGYGQSDKRLTLDYTNQSMAKDIATLMDNIGVEKFSLMGHDRGTVLTDHMTNVASLKGRIIRYVRMQQSFNEPHGKPVPPHFLFKSKFGTAMFKSKNMVNIVYTSWFPSNLTYATIQRLTHEFAFKGSAAAVSKYFETTTFDIELEDRQNYLFKSMTMPMLILQGKYDKGQHPAEYAQSPNFVSDARVSFIEASHFLHLENPVATNGAIRKFFAETSTSAITENETLAKKITGGIKSK